MLKDTFYHNPTNHQLQKSNYLKLIINFKLLLTKCHNFDGLSLEDTEAKLRILIRMVRYKINTIIKYDSRHFENNKDENVH